MTTAKYWQTLLVTLQFVSASALVLTSSLEVFGNPFTLLMVAGGAALGVWSWVTFGLQRITVMPELREDAELVTGGPYRFIRHPMYVAVLLFCGGFVSFPFRWWRLGLWFILLTVVGIKSHMEERFLLERFQKYASYQKHTGRFFPRRRTFKSKKNPS